MLKLQVKSVIEDEFWIITQGNIKVGQMKSNGSNIEIQVNGNTASAVSINELKDSGLFEFVDMPFADCPARELVHDYPTDGAAFNGVWDIKDGLPLYTQSEDSKSWYAAGYYKLDINGTFVVQYCPKLIALQRNKFTGPFKTNPGTNNFNELFE